MFEQYHKDAMLEEDILELITTIASVPENDSFTVFVVPQVFNIVKQYHTHAVVHPNPIEAQKLIDSGILKAMFTILGDYWVANVLSIQN